MTDEGRLVAGPVSLAGAVVAALGWWRGSRLLVFAGAVAIGGGLKLVGPRS